MYCLQKTVFTGQPTKPDYNYIPYAVFRYLLLDFACAVNIFFYMMVIRIPKLDFFAFFLLAVINNVELGIPIVGVKNQE